jgi:2-oxoglutarate ferredoxin oxidoreductase subunit alpha
MGELWKCCDAIAEAAVRAGCRFFSGYPITPQSPILEYLSWRLPEVGGVFIQAESELAAINIVLGAAASGVRAMTASSSPGVSLMQEGISYMAGCELPAVIVNMNRGGPGLGGIQPNQGDYFQSTKGGGHGDYRTPVLAPSSVQESVDFLFTAFDIADRYRNPVVVLGDAFLAGIMESVEMPDEWVPPFHDKPWALTGCQGRDPQLIKSLYLGPGELTEHDWKLRGKYEEIERQEVRWEEFMLEDAQLVVVAYGTAGRIAKTAVKWARDKGLNVGLVRPITLYPFPQVPLEMLYEAGARFLVAELNTGQMLEDVARVVKGETEFIGRPSDVFFPEEILEKIESIY